MTRLGWPYVAVAGLYFVFNVSQRYAQAMVVPFLPPCAIGRSSFYFITQLRRRRDVPSHGLSDLSVPRRRSVSNPAAAAATLRARRRDPDQRCLDEAAELVRDGKPEAASDLIATQIARPRRLGGDACAIPQAARTARTARRATAARPRMDRPSLLAQDKDRRAVDVARECIELDPAFELAEAGRCHARRAQGRRRRCNPGRAEAGVDLRQALSEACATSAQLPARREAARRAHGQGGYRAQAARSGTAERFRRIRWLPTVTAYRQFLDSRYDPCEQP